MSSALTRVPPISFVRQFLAKKQVAAQVTDKIWQDLVGTWTRTAPSKRAAFEAKPLEGLHLPRRLDRSAVAATPAATATATTATAATAAAPLPKSTRKKSSSKPTRARSAAKQRASSAAKKRASSKKRSGSSKSRK